MKFKICLLVIIFFGLSYLSEGQVIDSLLVSLPESEKEQRVDILCDLCWEYRFVNSDSAFLFGEKALELAIKLDYAKGIAQSYNDIGILFIDQGNYNNALEYFNNSLTIRINLKDSAGIASLHNKIGIVYQKKGHLKKSLESAIQALNIYEKLNASLWVGYCLNNIAIINYNLGNLETSLEYHKKALELRIIQNDKYGEAGSYSNMANVYLELGDTTQAIINYNNALEISRELNHKEPISVILANLGSVYMYKTDYGKALPFLAESLKLRMELGDKKAISSSLIKLGTVYSNTGDYIKSSTHLYKGMILAREIGILEEELQAYLELSKLYETLNQYDSSFKYLELYTILSDSVYDIRLEQQIIETQTKYDTERKDRDLELLKNENRLNEIRLKQRKTEILLLVFIIISLVGAGIFLYYRRKQKQQHAIDMERIRHNEHQIKAVLDGQEEERRKIARELHDSVGQSLSGVKLSWESISESLTDSQVKAKISDLARLIDSAANEVRTISHQMLPKELEQFGLVTAINGIVEYANHNSITSYNFVSHGVTERVSPAIELGMFRITQELINNVIKHADASEVTIQLLKRENSIVLIIEDNGVGFDYEKHSGTGIGLMNIQSRVTGLKGILNYQSSVGSGTVVTIRIPI